MKNINTTKIWENFDVSAMVQFLIMEGKADKTLESLKNPVDIVEARSNLAKFIQENNRFKKFLKLNDKILDRVLLFAFNSNLDINDALEKFIRKNTPANAAAKIDTVMILGFIANNSYKPVNNIDFDKEIDERIA